MDENQIDALTCCLANDGAGRRGLLKGLVAGGLAAVLGRSAGGAARAKKNGPCGTCHTLCDETPAGIFCAPPSETCVCVRSTSGKKHCADANLECPPADGADQCRQDDDCGPGAVCVPTAGGICCAEEGEGQFNICLRKCAAATARAGKAGDRSVLRGVWARMGGR
jgi:hypothetical protein